MKQQMGRGMSWRFNMNRPDKVHRIVLNFRLRETGQNDACDTAERIRQSVEAQAGITVSFGVSSFHRDLPDKESLIEQADRALYQAKQNGRNRGEGDCHRSHASVWERST